jgi:hypothetical protein
VSPDPLVVLTIAAGLALTVERILEAVKHIIDAKTPPSRVEMLKQAADITANTLKQARNAVESAKTSKPAPTIPSPAPTQTAPALDAPDSPRQPLMEIQGIEVLSATPRSLEKTRRLLFYQLFAAGAGILLAGLFDVRLFYAFLHDFSASSIEHFLGQWVLIDELLTGLIIGGGSQPVHLVIGYLTQNGGKSSKGA